MLSKIFNARGLLIVGPQGSGKGCLSTALTCTYALPEQVIERGASVIDSYFFLSGPISPSVLVVDLTLSGPLSGTGRNRLLSLLTKDSVTVNRRGHEPVEVVPPFVIIQMEPSEYSEFWRPLLPLHSLAVINIQEARK